MAFSNSQFCTKPSHRGLHVKSDKGPLVVPYLDAQLRLYEYLLHQWYLVFAYRFDLHFPADSYGWGSDVITSFNASLHSKIKHRANMFGCGHMDIGPRFIWAKENKNSVNDHYHYCTLIDGNFISKSGTFNAESWTLKKSIVESWAKALGISVKEAEPLVQHGENGDYLVELESSDFLQQLTNLFYRTSYFAKLDTKRYGDGSRNHRCSCVPLGFDDFNLDEYVIFHKREIHGILEDQFLYSSEHSEFSHMQNKNVSPLW
ncbi:inovirus-type Gp2 protein [Alcanivorax sp. 1008]|uniref:YagK/YfjJ domain-containing protein n=1 Tax=Alcanivorax sp. 1008 TaxID=2816853 RepID=UPI001E06E619|nr:inovirus-type Gp2 protein [Alcanivorax sp. 1008]MCC1497940.1 inovirus Gp2 family protein [Alcanivorax sp. 1008]